MNTNHNYCLIMCGGIGSRFWPVSRQCLPKQFLDFFGTGETLLQQTFRRFRKVVPMEHIYVVSNVQYRELVKQQLPELSDGQILLEPSRRNTAPCIAWACCHIQAVDPEAAIVVTPADHLILKEEEFLDAVQKSMAFAAENPLLVTLGIRPSRVETRYGYVQVDEERKGDFFRVKTFTEKPEYDLAKVFVESGEFYWNSGLFVWKIETFMEAVKRWLPELYAKLAPGVGLFGTDAETAFIAENFPSFPNVSIDLGVMERADNTYMLIGDFGWADLGTWSTLYDAYPKDRDENVVVEGHTMLYNSHGNIVALPKDKLAVVQGLDGYLIAENDKVLLICKRDEENDIRKFVNDVQIKLGEDYV